jgi:predicted N-acyltransferase
MAISPFYRTEWKEAIDQVEAVEWDRLAKPLPTPFLEWEWLRQMEISGSISRRAGWMPRHLTVWRRKRLVAAAALYIKNSSVGEFVFDHVWADLARRIGVDYYPKLVGMSPVTPMEGYRFLMDPQEDPVEMTALMVEAIDRLCLEYRLSGCHFLFADPGWVPSLNRHRFLKWQHQYFAWHNPGFIRFDDYLAEFKSNQRRNIKRERRRLAAAGIRLRTLRGEAISRQDLATAYHFYADTNARFGPWGCKYLNKAFFLGLHGRFRQRLLLVTAEREDDEGRPVGISFLVTKGDRLYGRYWGSSGDIANLHFNACYYEPIRWAIHHNLKRFDPGIGGDHKIRRGFLSIPSVSLHRFYDPHMQRIVQHVIGDVNRLELDQIARVNAAVPMAARQG